MEQSVKVMVRQSKAFGTQQWMINPLIPNLSTRHCKNISPWFSLMKTIDKKSGKKNTTNEGSKKILPY